MKHLEKLFYLFEKHLTSTNISPRKEEGSYTSLLKKEKEFIFIYTCKILPTFKE
jgi:hypothetical protein